MLLAFFGRIFLLIVLGILLIVYWLHVKAILIDIAKEEADQYIDEEVDRILDNAEIKVKQQLWLVYGKGMERSNQGG